MLETPKWVPSQDFHHRILLKLQARRPHRAEYGCVSPLFLAGKATIFGFWYNPKVFAPIIGCIPVLVIDIFAVTFAN